MPKIDWSKALDLDKAISNVRNEFPGDWHLDPWGWPEIGFILKKRPDFVYKNCDADGSREVALLDVPKENWGIRPAVVLDVVDRLTYQALVDRVSVNLIGTMPPTTYGWRLVPSAPVAGQYALNSHQWENYREQLSLLASLYDVALRTDIVSCFATIPIGAAQEAIQDRTKATAVTSRICDILAGFGAIPDRSGLPQRSTASAVIANMFLSPLDDILAHHSSTLPRRLGSALTYQSCARWMDDMWWFGSDAATARRTQTDLQTIAASLGLNLNSAKTDVLEGTEVALQARQVEHSAVDDALLTDNQAPLEELIDALLDDPDRSSRTSSKFASLRMRQSGCRYRVQDIIAKTPRMPHNADSWARLFKEAFVASSLEDWYLDYAGGEWATHQWAIAQLGRMFSAHKRPRKALRSYFADRIRDANTSLPLLAVACSRLASWDEPEVRSACNDAHRRASTPHARRVLALTALGAGETRTKVKRWLGADPENEPTLAMLDSVNYVPPKMVASFID